MTRSWILSAMIALAASSADASPSRSRRQSDELRLVFLDAGDGSPVRQGTADSANVDLGRVVARRCGSRTCMTTVVRKRFRLRVDGRAATRFVRVSAFVQDGDPAQLVRVDGKLVTAVPQVIGAATPLGIAVAHTVEIQVSASAPSGLMSHNLVWLVEDAR